MLHYFHIFLIVKITQKQDLGGGKLFFYGPLSLKRKGFTQDAGDLHVIYGPRQANLVLIAYASSEGSGEPTHPRSLARTFAARSYKQ